MITIQLEKNIYTIKQMGSMLSFMLLQPFNVGPHSFL